MLLSDHQSILLRPRCGPEADDEGPSESKLVVVADTGGDKIARRQPDDSQNLLLCLRRCRLFAEAANVLVSAGTDAH